MQPEEARLLLVNSSVVLVANQINLSIFTPIWFAKQQILREDEFTPGTLISPGVVQIPTAGFNLLILPDRVQMLIVQDKFATASSELARVLGGVVRTLPHTPFKGVGLNFDFIAARPQSAAFSDWNRGLFSAPCLADLNELKEPSARFGTYFSLNLLGMRLRVTVKPVATKPVTPDAVVPFQEEAEKIQAAFNFHKGFAQQPSVEELLAAIGAWSASREQAVKIAHTMFGVKKA